MKIMSVRIAAKNGEAQSVSVPVGSKWLGLRRAGKGFLVDVLGEPKAKTELVTVALGKEGTDFSGCCSSWSGYFPAGSCLADGSLVHLVASR